MARQMEHDSNTVFRVVVNVTWPNARNELQTYGPYTEANQAERMGARRVRQLAKVHAKTTFVVEESPASWRVAD